MNNCLVLKDAMSMIEKQVSECLDCDKTFVFIKDEEKQELWTNIGNH